MHICIYLHVHVKEEESTKMSDTFLFYSECKRIVDAYVYIWVMRSTLHNVMDACHIIRIAKKRL